jgi:dimethylaniline monooxygenase (N-oxide forming)
MSDFPIPESYPEFPHHSLVLDYMKKYIENFNLSSNIFYDHCIIKIYKENDKWVTIYKTINCEYKIYSKNIVIGTGQNSKCINMPSIDYSQFKGTIIHANDYNDTFMNNYCLNKRILIYGGSDTASDIADELTNNMYIKNDTTYGYRGKDNTISNKKTIVYLSMRKGRWIQRRMATSYIFDKNTENLNQHTYKSAPADMYYSRALDFMIKKTSKNMINNGFAHELEQYWGKNGHGIKEWNTDAGYLNSYYLKSANIVHKVSIGEINPLGMITQIKQNTVEAKIDDKIIEIPIDVIIFATGYNGLKCFIEFSNNIINGDYYEHIFLIEDPTLVKIGFIRPYLTSIPMLIEMQSRYIAKVFANKIKLPNNSTMKKEYKEYKMKQESEFNYDYARVTGIVDPYDYMNLIGKKIKAIPNILELLKEDKKLLKIIYFGSWSHFFYRLNDPDITKRKIAREQIYLLDKNTTSNGIMDRIYNSIMNKKEAINMTILTVLIYIIIGIFIIILLIKAYKN